MWRRFPPMRWNLRLWSFRRCDKRRNYKESLLHAQSPTIHTRYFLVWLSMGMIPFVCRRILKRRQKCYDSLNCQMCHRLRSIHASYVAYVHKVHTFTFGTMFGQYLPSCRRTYIVHAVHVVSRQGHATAQNTKKFGHYAFVVNCCQVFAHYRIARARSLYNNWFSFKIGLKCGAHIHTETRTDSLKRK